MGAGRPEKRVTARSKAPQKKCDGLDLPRNSPRNREKTRSALTSECQNVDIASASYEQWVVSSANGTAWGSSTGVPTIRTSRPSSRRWRVYSSWKSATVRGASAIRRLVPSVSWNRSSWFRKSNLISSPRSPAGMSDVVSPEPSTYSVTPHQWFTAGPSAMRVFPTICVHR
ncbi:hypothetical protein A3K89_04570 [Rhodococcoides kyotonense]|uniref:Uncharacterized protein n=1 Tax=Rhodococcoides kyotonense TaxID=398843 RepID=A0A177YHC0_9NOCA|nr:hypothetical protein A3K89_04570 [Rhodococcus kyotonensis]